MCRSRRPAVVRRSQVATMARSSSSVIGGALTHRSPLRPRLLVLVQHASGLLRTRLLVLRHPGADRGHGGIDGVRGTPQLDEVGDVLDTIAEWAGEASPHGMQHLLCRAVWDADAVRDDVREYVVEHLL